MEETLTITPRRPSDGSCPTICRATAWVRNSMPFKLMSSTWVKLSSVMRRRSVRTLGATPALFIRMSIRPKASTDPATYRSRSARSARLPEK